MLKSLMNLLLSKFCLKTEVTELNSPQVESYMEVSYSSLPENPELVTEKLYIPPFDGWVCLDGEPLDTGSYTSYVNSCGILSYIYAQARRSVYVPVKKGQRVHVKIEGVDNAILRVIRRVGSPPPHSISPKGGVLCLRNLYSFLQRNFLLAKGYGYQHKEILILLKQLSYLCQTIQNYILIYLHQMECSFLDNLIPQDMLIWKSLPRELNLTLIKIKQTDIIKPFRFLLIRESLLHIRLQQITEVSLLYYTLSRLLVNPRCKLGGMSC